MQITITGKHRTLSDSLKQYIEGKVTELTNYYERIIDARVVLDREKKSQVVVIHLRVAGQTLITENKSTNLRVAIDAGIDKLEKQLVKYKQKWQRKGVKQLENLSVGVEHPVDIDEPEPAEEQGAILTFEEEDQADLSQKTGS